MAQAKYSKEDATLFPTDDPTLISFDYGAPGPDLLPVKLIPIAAQTRFARDDADHALQYGPVLGDKEFRVELAKFLTKEYADVPVNYENLAVTSGATQSFFNIITLFTYSKTIFLVEDPTYFLAIRMLADHGFSGDRLIPIPTDEHGLQVDAVAETLSRLSSTQSDDTCPPGRYPYLLYLVPNHNNPTGSTLISTRREQLVKLARKHNVLVVCDDVYNLLHYDPTTPPTKRVVAYDDLKGSGNVISNCSFSKIFAPGVRVGWIEAATGIINRLAGSGVMYSGGSPNHLTTGLLTSLLQTSHFSQNLVSLRTTYATRMNAMITTLQTHLPPTAHFVPPKGGYFIWITLPPHINTTQLKQALFSSSTTANPVFSSLVKERVSFKPGAEFSLKGDTCQNCLRLSFAYYDVNILVEGCKRLCRVLKSVC
ncbi:uncharacterized protein SPPG_06034 [Spizellomyces punctatus DAOM BR117]|uniref:Aminotransferase class I/classII large domain-containing protein n=1 Tax=Spizellomyces punctatus (strain DAOM BR117) TaxID=645134 RepID=A0A0L0HED1_SPIPD|nr:uncharacterized protein SPPG_06034 [Spizellomyces punctatus DAOM BR117]KNC99088.1 hypothetical protein SPPG_06034 [Spizellomyces punctatus DAOM BR117]|eukprot:XP_016607128.1 hypothetical protein SPPG_06034 [Spizellomyces punctatus DAOM BR117]